MAFAGGGDPDGEQLDQDADCYQDDLRLEGVGLSLASQAPPFQAPSKLEVGNFPGVL